VHTLHASCRIGGLQSFRYELCKDPDGAARLRARPDGSDAAGGLGLTGYQAKELIRAVCSPKDPTSLHAAEQFRADAVRREAAARADAAAAAEKVQQRLVDRKTTLAARTQVWACTPPALASAPKAPAARTLLALTCASGCCLVPLAHAISHMYFYSTLLFFL
jgi:hypothetical protein